MSVTRFFSRSAVILFAMGLLMSSGCSSSKPVMTATERVNEGYAKAQKLYDQTPVGKFDHLSAVLRDTELQLIATGETPPSVAELAKMTFPVDRMIEKFKENRNGKPE